MINTPKYIIVHHSGGTDANPLADSSNQTLEIIKDWHVNHNGWDDIGYHWVIEKSGKVREGRKENVHGAHTVGYNTQSIGICVVGNFDVTMPTKEQVDALTILLKEVSKRYNIDILNILPHRKFAGKTCYGKNLREGWAQDLIREKETPTFVPPTIEIKDEPTVIKKGENLNSFDSLLLWFSGKKSSIFGILATTTSFLVFKEVMDADTAAYINVVLTIVFGTASAATSVMFKKLK